MRATSFLFLFFIGFQILAQSPEHAAKEPFHNLVENGLVAGIAGAVVQDEEVVWLAASGVRSEDEPMTVNTVLRIASIAKPMTAVAVMQLVESGKVDLDAPLTQYLPGYPQWQEITPRHLLSHTSGIGAYASKREAENTMHYPSIEAAVNIFSDRELESVPGKTFAYTTYGYVVLGLLIERVSGTTYDSYMRENIFEPAGMLHTFVEGNVPDDQPVSALYLTTGKGKIKSDKQTDLSDRIPGGGLLSTVEDVMLFMEALLEYKLITRASFEELITDTGAKAEGNPYGMGWYLYGENLRLGNTIGHTGSQAGCSAHLFVFPEHQSGVVVIANTSNAMQAVSSTAVQLFGLIETR